MKNLSPSKKRYSLFEHPMLLTKIHTLFSVVFFFLFTSSLWAQLPNLDKILASDGAAADFFGWSVSISGDQLVIGAYRDDDNGSDSGSAYIGVQDVVLSFTGEQVQTYAFYQNTPNPFKGETRIAFELPTAATATITIKDMNGNVVSVIHGDYAEGYNSVSVEGLSTTGVMYYTLKSGDFTATKKMILVR